MRRSGTSLSVSTLIVFVLLVPGCGAGGGSSDGACDIANSIVGVAYVPDPNVPNATPPRGSIADAEGRTDIVVTSSSIPPPGYLPLVGAMVSIVGTDVNIRTGDGGLFSFGGLRPGRYRIRISSQGREPLEFIANVCERTTERVTVRDPDPPPHDPEPPSRDPDRDDTSGGPGSTGEGQSSAGGGGSEGSFNRVPK